MDCSSLDLGGCALELSRAFMASPWTYAIVVAAAAIEAGVSLHRKRFDPGARFSFLPLAFLCVHRRGTMSVVDALIPLAYAVSGALALYACLWLLSQYRSVERHGEGE